MKYKHTVLGLLAAAITIAFSSCAGICPRPQPAKAEPAGCSGKVVGAPAGSCANPMSPSCRGECSPGDCTCQKHPCKCASKVAAKPKPAPVKHVAVATCAPPRVVVRQEPLPPPPVQEPTGVRIFKPTAVVEGSRDAPADFAQVHPLIIYVKPRVAGAAAQAQHEESAESWQWKSGNAGGGGFRRSSSTSGSGSGFSR